MGATCVFDDRAKGMYRRVDMGCALTTASSLRLRSLFLLNVTVIFITPHPPLRLFCAGVSWGRVCGQGGNSKPLAVSGNCSTSSK